MRRIHYIGRTGFLIDYLPGAWRSLREMIIIGLAGICEVVEAAGESLMHTARDRKRVRPINPVTNGIGPASVRYTLASR